MAKPNQATSKAEVSERFEAQIKQTVETSGKRYQGLSSGGRVSHMVPEGWEGDPRAIEKMKAPFDRQQLEEQYQSVHTSPDDSGTTGDAAAITLQSDWLAVSERSFRVRQSSPVRDIMHMAARHKGHANSRGVFQFGVLGYIQNILKASSTQSAAAGAAAVGGALGGGASGGIGGSGV